MEDPSIDEMLDRAVKKAERLKTIELKIEVHDKAIDRFDVAMTSMTNWFKGMVFSIFSGIATAIILTFLLRLHP